MALALLLAALAQPAGAAADTAVHQHIAQHHGEATHSHHPASDAPENGTQQVASAKESHGHEHEHRVAFFLRPTRSTDSPSLSVLPSATPSSYGVAIRRGPTNRDATPSPASPEASGSSEPRAPPTA